MKALNLFNLLIVILLLGCAQQASAQWLQNPVSVWTFNKALNVGIGTSTPEQKLDVNGDAKMNQLFLNKNFNGSDGGLTLNGNRPTIRFNATETNQKWLMHIGADYNGAFELFNSTDGNWGAAKFSVAPGTGEVRTGQILVNKNFDGSDGGLTLNGNRPTMRFNSSETNQKWLVHVGGNYNGAFEFFNSTDGNWGTAKFSIAPGSGDVRTGQILINRDFNGSDGGLTLNGNRPTIRLNSTENNQQWLVHVGSDYNGAFELFNATDGNWGAAKFSVSPGTGNVLIGTARNPEGFKLCVGGKVICEELKVQLQSAWPDYVFTPGHQLLSLDAVAQHIAEKGHLPNIPSACDIEENGLQVGEMQTKMMEKIEELTLYLIEQKKEIDALKAELAKLK